jgi:hypothetical protein
MTRALLVGLVLAAAVAWVAAQGPPSRPWFGVPAPPSPGGSPAVIVGARAPRPVTVPAGEPLAPELVGTEIKTSVDAIVRFSHASRSAREIGSGQMWGRISGFPSSAQTIAWAADQFRRAGIGDVRLQSFDQEAAARFWLPLSWEVRLLGDTAFGAGSADVVLHSAIPIGPSNIPGGSLTAPLIFVGGGNPSLVEHVDVTGKIAVQLIVPQGHMLFERGAVDAHAEELVKRGAAGVFNLVRLPGNELSRDFSNCGNPCVNIGGRDGWFLERVIDHAAQAGVLDKLRVRITLATETFSGLKAQNAVAVIPGRSTEVVILNAHADGWFDGAGDNADGLAVLVALARHFAKPANTPARTLVLVASAGHHSPGLNGPRNFIAMNSDLAKRAVMMINVEHVAQRNFSPARSTASDGYREAVADTGEAPIYAGVSNRAPFVDRAIADGVTRYGVNFVSTPSNLSSGETGGYASLPISRITIIQAPPLYHTTGETAEVISTPGLERMARFLAFFVKAVGSAPRSEILPEPPPFD